MKKRSLTLLWHYGLFAFVVVYWSAHIIHSIRRGDLRAPVHQEGGE